MENQVNNEVFIDKDKQGFEVFKDNEGVSVTFNVMPGRKVSESFSVQKYHIYSDRVEAFFSRDYVSEMKNSPSHVIFLTMLVHFQKMSYLLMCKYFNLPIDTKSEELIKIWPIDLHVKMHEMIEEESELKQVLQMTNMRKCGNGKYMAFGHTTISSKSASVTTTGKTMILNLNEA